MTPAYRRLPDGEVDDCVRIISFAVYIQTSCGPPNPQSPAHLKFFLFHAFSHSDDPWPSHRPASLPTIPKHSRQCINANTGFIVLEHDLYQETVALAVGSSITLSST